MSAVAIAGGGTGGHVTMALALGEAFAARGVTPLFFGAVGGFEERLVPAAGFELIALSMSPVVGRSALQRLRAAVSLARAIPRVARSLLARRIAAVFSVGGYAAAPVIPVAIGLRRRLFLVEPNAVPGVTHRTVARFAERVFTAFPSAAEVLGAGAAARIENVGAPLRGSLRGALQATPRRPYPGPERRPLRLLVLGGSQGARQLNDAMIGVLPHLAAGALAVVHQSGAADRGRVARAYHAAGLCADVLAFEDNLAARYRWADLALARSGALTVAELALAELPALLVPYPHAADDHQRANAAALANAGAARVLEERDLDGAALAAALRDLAADPRRLAAMTAAAAGCARPDAAERIVGAYWSNPVAPAVAAAQR